MPDPDRLQVSATSDKLAYAHGEVPRWTVTVTTEAGEPVYADLQWGLRVLPDGDWLDYSREFPMHTSPDTGTANWGYPDEFGPPDPGDYEMSIEARAYENGDMTGEGAAELKFRVER